jgi:hypothetical protein
MNQSSKRSADLGRWSGLTDLCGVWLGAASFFWATAQCLGQGTVHITFDGYPFQPPSTGAFVQQYFESGMWFRPLGIVGPGNGFIRNGGGRVNSPENGTAYLQGSLGDSLVFSFLDDSVFNLVSVDLAEYSTVVPDAVTVPFVGYRHDGSMVITSFTTDGIIDGTGPLADFQTFHLGPEFTGLTRVEIPTYGWSLDNLYVSITIPEPGAGGLLLLGAALAGLSSTNKNRWKRKPASPENRLELPARRGQAPKPGQA